ncbi:YcjF family protein [Coralliovum pocilloporae]|uniref:YcjF family protein n=1 Tax=Coralliovum pocilloporae TaxID=3066369 RepID=UPI0033075715
MTAKRQPGAFDPNADNVISAPKEAPEQEDISSPHTPETSGQPAKRRTGWLTVLGSALFGLLLIWLTESIWTTLQDALNGTSWFGWATLACLSLALLSVLGLIAREAFALRRLGKVEQFRSRFTDDKTHRDRKTAELFTSELIAHFRHIPETARDRHSLKTYMKDVMDADDLLILTERTLIAPIDERAIAVIRRNALRASAITALSPRAIIDILAILYLSARTVRDISELYAGRPGFIGMCRIARSAVTHLAVTGTLAAGDTLLQQLLGHGLASRLSARLGEGILNGLMTVRLGLAVMAVCRPVPFTEDNRPRLKTVANGLFEGVVTNSSETREHERVG